MFVCVFVHVHIKSPNSSDPTNKTGLFGMNLLSGLESHPSAFYVVTVVGGVAMLAVLGAIVMYGVKVKLF